MHKKRVEFDSKFDVCVSSNSWHDLEKLWHDFDSEIWVLVQQKSGHDMFSFGAHFWIMFSFTVYELENQDTILENWDTI